MFLVKRQKLTCQQCNPQTNSGLSLYKIIQIDTMHRGINESICNNTATKLELLNLDCMKAAIVAIAIIAGLQIVTCKYRDRKVL